MHNKMVSVVITTYQRELDILNCAVQSVLNQTYNNVELIIVDDNGKGSEKQLLNEATFRGKEKICYIANEKNMGAQVSRNRGILSSSGEYIGFLDDDDWWGKNKLEKQLPYFKQDIALVFCNGFIVTDDNKKKELYRNSGKNSYFEKKIDFSMMLWDDCVGSTSQVLVKKEVFAMAGLFNVDMQARQDYEMWIRISKYYKLYGINEPLFYHRIHKGEQISKNSKKVISGYKKISEIYKKDLKENKYAKARMNLRVAYVAFKSRQCIIGFVYSIKAFFISPKCFFYKLFNNGILKKGSIYE